jgi:predicted nuclease with TOPRIM domain
MDEKRRLQVNLEKVISSVPEMRDEKDRLAKERDKLERELEKQRYLARELQDQVTIIEQSFQRQPYF